MPEEPRLYTRPIPVIGDPTSAAQRAADPQGWQCDETDKASFYKILESRRDIRRYRPDQINPETVDKVLQAAHNGPSVGHSQPWRFIVITDDEIRSKAAIMADKARLDQAALLQPDAARKLLDLQLEGIREAPTGIVVACDRRSNHKGVLGRATFVDADMWSCACAIQNLWLAARAEGLGVGWVTLFDPEELGSLLNLPAGVETLGWLCIGYPDERPPEPGLVRQGWSKRLPLEKVVSYNSWPETGFADLTDYYEGIVERVPTLAPSQEAVIEIRDRADQLLTPPGSLGLIDHTLNRVLAVTTTPLDAARLFMVGADHKVCRFGVSAFPQAVSAHIMDAAANDCAYGSIAAQVNNIAVTVVDAGINEPVEGALHILGSPDAASREAQLASRGDIVTTDALPLEEAQALVDAGFNLGNTCAEPMICLGEVGIGNTTIAAALTAALLNISPADTAGLGAGSDSAMIDVKAKVIHQALQRIGNERDPMKLLSAIGGGEFAVLTGIVLGAVKANKVVVLDGLAGSIPALLASRIDPGVPTYLVAGQRSRERAHAGVLRALGLEPILDLRIRAGEGIGAVMTAGLLIRTVTMRDLAAKTG